MEDRYISTLEGKGLTVTDSKYDYYSSIESDTIHIGALDNSAYVNFYAYRLQTNEGISVNYKDIVTKDQLPTKTSQLTNDSGYITDSVLSAVAKSGSYNDLSDKPTIPTDNNQLANGAGYQTASDVSTAISGQTKETLQFVLADGTTVTKTFVLG